MNFLTVIVVFTAEAVLLKTLNAQDEDCDYQYIKQPPLTNDVMCNPYSMGSQLTLKCELQIPEQDLELASIRWFNGSEEITVGVIDQMTSVQHQPAISSTITFSYTDLDDRYVNDFSCVLELRDESWLPSDSLVLSDYNDYMNYLACAVSDVYYEDVQKCAVVPSTRLSTTLDSALIITSLVSFSDTTSMITPTTVSHITHETTMSIFTDPANSEAPPANSVLITVAIVTGLVATVSYWCHTFCCRDSFGHLCA